MIERDSQIDREREREREREKKREREKERKKYQHDFVTLVVSRRNSKDLQI